MNTPATPRSPLVETIDNTGARLGGISRSSVYRLAGNGQLTLVKIGGRSMITAESIERLASGDAA